MVFTYGSSGYPFVGGWTEVEAPSVSLCLQLFHAYHPDKTPGILSCADYYTWNDFKETSMYKAGNFGAKRHEKITVLRVRTNPYRSELFGQNETEEDGDD